MERIIRYDRRARRRMKWRKISETEIMAVLKEPDKIEQTVYGRINIFKKIGSRYLNVTYKKLGGFY